MIPRVFVKLHSKHKTPVNALILIGILSVAAPLFGRKMLVWVVDAGNFGYCLAYCMVALSFIILRKKVPEMKRPYKVKHYRTVGVLAVIMSGFMVVMYVLPFSGCALVKQEWYMAGGWAALGAVFFVIAKLCYKEKFATHIDVITDGEDAPLERPNAERKAREVEEAIGLVRAEKPVEVRKPSSFAYYLPVNIEFGAGKVRRIGSLSKAYGKKALIVTGGSSAKKSGLYDRIKANLEAEGIETALFDKATPNPLTSTAEEGSKECRAAQCDMVVGVGGGSTMDLSKAIVFLAVNDGDINDYIYGREKSDKALPIVLVPTTCGTGSEGNGFAVLTNPDNGDKKSLRCNAIVPKLSIVDPDCMKTMPKSVLASVGFDALCHLMEAYTSKIAQPYHRCAMRPCDCTHQKEPCAIVQGRGGGRRVGRLDACFHHWRHGEKARRALPLRTAWSTLQAGLRTLRTEKD